jgi:hypothetical protein
MEDDSRSSTDRSKWMDAVLPSAADLIFVGLLGVLALTPLSVKLLGDAGIGWHIRTGQQILATHAIPRVDSFSSTMQGKPWFAWEWLYDVVVGEFDSRLGLNGVVWFTAMVIAAVFAWMFRLLIARGTNMLAALILTLLTISASMIHFLARPHVVSWGLTLAWFWVLDDGERRSGTVQRGYRRMWILPLLMLVWVNLHGGFVVGFVLLAIFWLGAAWEWWTTKDGAIEKSLQRIAAARRVRTLTLVGLVSAATSLGNPYGWRLHAHIYSYLTNRFLMDHIEEFQSPNFHGIAQRCFAILLLIALAALAMRGREVRMSGVLVILFAVYAGLYASRNIPVSSVLLAMVVGPLWPSVRAGAGFFQRMAAIEVRLRWHLWPWLAMVATFLIAVNGGRVGSDQLMDGHFDAKRMPVQALDFIAQQGARGPILSTDFWGGYLIYRMYPRARVVVDDRHDLYGEEFLKSYLKMFRVERGWQEFLDAHETYCVVLPRNSALANVLIANGQWKEIYGDEVATVFERGRP